MIACLGVLRCFGVYCWLLCLVCYLIIVNLCLRWYCLCVWMLFFVVWCICIVLILLVVCFGIFAVSCYDLRVLDLWLLFDWRLIVLLWMRSSLTLDIKLLFALSSRLFDCVFGSGFVFALLVLVVYLFLFDLLVVGDLWCDVCLLVDFVDYFVCCCIWLLFDAGYCVLSLWHVGVYDVIGCCVDFMLEYCLLFWFGYFVVSIFYVWIVWMFVC